MNNIASPETRMLKDIENQEVQELACHELTGIVGGLIDDVLGAGQVGALIDDVLGAGMSSLKGKSIPQIFSLKR